MANNDSKSRQWSPRELVALAADFAPHRPGEYHATDSDVIQRLAEKHDRTPGGIYWKHHHAVTSQAAPPVTQFADLALRALVEWMRNNETRLADSPWEEAEE